MVTEPPSVRYEGSGPYHSCTIVIPGLGELPLQLVQVHAAAANTSSDADPLVGDNLGPGILEMGSSPSCPWSCAQGNASDGCFHRLMELRPFSRR
jgi:hypothetical protein